MLVSKTTRGADVAQDEQTEQIVVDEDAPIEDSVPFEDPDNAEDLTPDVPAIDLDDIEKFTEAVEQHDEVGKGETDGDEQKASQESEAAAEPEVKQ